ncbi:MAG: UDP-N-acetylmuramoyl-tripeptide--D-alanyl-D-alanine ligase [Pegethrix bostrychoides GSE-TBD4-15B]|jgi:UDP-N-acetylmuramoyl-tripeptide--D-alanyl-D-alanine ligase|uniref:UDP-N-acetylmuramoyl-tripeptide--D-alanyl-D-alanine ligase n=1 Tax=Pegethrix bostrychoides GSE-TBD4-15B TaxID=2839662 RepID=A0A951PDT4_9CYAN|nr:UDP-N-acetylmuramoyl-tripeptide--D-alanyl-D-alanine ligase [Pegethrix bostrychoides GSE-TBD4-15B]
MAYPLTLRKLIQLLSLDFPDGAIPAVQLDQQLCQISTDSRTIQPGSLFVALRGERYDGHAFLDVAQQQGALAAIVNRQVNRQPGWPAQLCLLPVADTLQAYQQIGQWWRKQVQIPVIAVTGSVGKTTTKELIAALLATQGQVLKTQANYNNEIGLPKTLLELRPEHDFAVVEMGMRAAGEIALLSQIACPDIAVITNVGTAHIGRLGSEQAIADAKCELLQAMPASGTAVLNADNLRLMQTAAQVWPGPVLTYGLEAGNLRGELLDAETLVVRGNQIKLPLPGRHNASNYLAAIAVAELLQIDWSALLANAPALSVELPQGRARRIQLPNDLLLLDETYNAGLESMLAALQMLADTPATRRIAVLGTMKELGEQSQELHKRVGAMAQKLKLDALLILADPAEAIAMAEGALPLVAEQFSNQAELINRLRTLMAPGDRILFKASRAVGLDQVVQRLQVAPTL